MNIFFKKKSTVWNTRDFITWIRKRGTQNWKDAEDKSGRDFPENSTKRYSYEKTKGDKKIQECTGASIFDCHKEHT